MTPDGRVSVYSLGEIAPTEDWFIPTLKELIEACEKKTAVTTSSLSIHNSDGLRLLNSRQANLQRVLSADCRRSSSSPVVGIENAWRDHLSVNNLQQLFGPNLGKTSCHLSGNLTADNRAPSQPPRRLPAPHSVASSPIAAVGRARNTGCGRSHSAEPRHVSRIFAPRRRLVRRSLNSSGWVL